MLQEVSTLSVLKLHIPYEEMDMKKHKEWICKHVYVFIDFVQCLKI